MTNLNVIQPHIHPSEVIRGIATRDVEGLNVVFINMPLRETAVPNTTPEGPLLMATNLIRNYGVNASLIDLNAYRRKDELAQKRGLVNGRHLTQEEAFDKIKRHFVRFGEPDLVCLSGMITTLKWQKAVAKMVRRLVPHTMLVSGGGLATELKTGLFNYIPELDAVAHSEGDDIIVKICCDAATIRRFSRRHALNSGKLEPYLLKDGSGRLMYEGDRPDDLDRFPWADLELLKEDVDGEKVLEKYIQTEAWGLSANNSSAAPFVTAPKTTSVSSRGCPYGCKYCYRGAQGERKWHVRSARHLVEEIKEHTAKYGIAFKSWPDDNFAVTFKRIKELRDIIVAEGIKIPWGTHTRLDEAAGLKPNPAQSSKERNFFTDYIFEDPLRVNLMAEAGCRYIGFGPESAHLDTLEELGKGGFTTRAGLIPVSIDGRRYWFPKAMVYGIKHTMEAGIHSNCTWIMGNPSETLERLKQTVAFMKWQIDYYATFGIPEEAVNKNMFTLTWYPGTELINHPKVRAELTRVFGLNFQLADGKWEPVCDEAFYNYCLELDDATKLLHGPDGEPLNFSDMPNDVFLQAREYVDSGQTLRILDM
ncbi:MAG: radical SAM protein [Patescibacteria group bacterium]